MSDRTEEARWLAAYDPEKYERPSVAVDVVILTVAEGALRALLLPRSAPPFAGHWVLPGTFVGPNESLDGAARRVLQSKGGLDGVYLEQLYSFGAPQRDPRTRVISIAYYALVDAGRLDFQAATARFFPLRVLWEGEAGGPVEAMDGDSPLRLGFDHAEILGMAVKRIRGKLDYTPIGFQLLPSTFTLRRLQEVHETVRAAPLNKDSFRRKMLASGLLEATGERERAVGHRPAELYRFAKRSAI